MDANNLHHPLVPRAGAGSSGGEDNSHRFVPAPSVGHEIGVMFGGIGSMLVGMFLFWAWWQTHLKREARKEAARIEGLRQRGILKEQLPRPDSEEDSGKGKEAQTETA